MSISSRFVATHFSERGDEMSAKRQGLKNKVRDNPTFWCRQWMCLGMLERLGMRVRNASCAEH